MKRLVLAFFLLLVAGTAYSQVIGGGGGGGGTGTVSTGVPGLEASYSGTTTTGTCTQGHCTIVLEPWAVANGYGASAAAVTDWGAVINAAVASFGGSTQCGTIKLRGDISTYPVTTSWDFERQSCAVIGPAPGMAFIGGPITFNFSGTANVQNSNTAGAGDGLLLENLILQGPGGCSSNTAGAGIHAKGRIRIYGVNIPENGFCGHAVWFDSTAGTNSIDDWEVKHSRFYGTYGHGFYVTGGEGQVGHMETTALDCAHSGGLTNCYSLYDNSSYGNTYTAIVFNGGYGGNHDILVGANMAYNVGSVTINGSYVESGSLAAPANLDVKVSSPGTLTINGGVLAQSVLDNGWDPSGYPPCVTGRGMASCGVYYNSTALTTGATLIANKATPLNLSSSQSFTLPSSPQRGMWVTVTDVAGTLSGSVVATISPAAGNINGASTYPMLSPFASVTFVYTGSQWNVMSSAGGSGTIGSSTAGYFAQYTGPTTIGGVQYIPIANNSQGAAYTAVASDAGNLITATTGSWTLTLPTTLTTGGCSGVTPVATGYNTSVQNSGAGTITVTPCSGTINGVASYTLSQNQGVAVLFDGTNYEIWSGSSGSGTVTANSTPTSGFSAGKFLYSNGSLLQGGTFGTGLTFSGGTLTASGGSGGNPGPYTVGTLISGSGALTNPAVNNTYCVNVTGAATMTLPSATSGQRIVLKNCDGSLTGTNTLTISPTSSTIDGAATYVMNAPYQETTFWWNNQGTAQWSTEQVPRTNIITFGVGTTSYTPTPGAKSIKVWLLGGGGSGGSGGVAISGTNAATGGGGGGGGELKIGEFRVADLPGAGASALSMVVGAGGTGPSGVTGNTTTAGTAGAGGNPTYLWDGSSVYVLKAWPGGGGGPGASATAVGGGGGGGTYQAGGNTSGAGAGSGGNQNGGAGSASGAAAGASNSANYGGVSGAGGGGSTNAAVAGAGGSNSQGGASGGGAGGGATSVPAATGGANSGSIFYSTTVNAASAGTAGNAGSNGSTFATTQPVSPGTGGGGGGGNTSAGTGGKGGNGKNGGGGGGGGGVVSTGSNNTSGAGGNGGDGIGAIEEFF